MAFLYNYSFIKHFHIICFKADIDLWRKKMVAEFIFSDLNLTYGVHGNLDDFRREADAHIGTGQF
jgi:hypothetical protein